MNISIILSAILGTLTILGTVLVLVVVKLRKDFNCLDLAIGRLDAQREPRVFSIGIKPQVIEGGETVTIQAPTQNLFKLTRIFIPSTICHDVSIDDVLVGDNSQFVGPVPGALFSEVSVLPELSFSRAEIDEPISLVVSNLSAGRIFFHAVLVGNVYDGPPVEKTPLTPELKEEMEEFVAEANETHASKIAPEESVAELLEADDDEVVAAVENILAKDKPS